MVSTDPIADMLTRIRNAILVQKREISLPHSNIKQSVAEVLQKNGFLSGVKVVEASIGRELVITINGEGENAKITEITRLSKPGRRVYYAAKDIPTIKRGRGIVVVSTSKGLLTGKEAKAQHIGGELICSVY